MPSYVLTNFQILRPKHEISQQQAIEWMASAYVEATALKQEGVLSVDEKKTHQQGFVDRFLRYGCKPGNIDARGHELPDFLHGKWDEMDIYHFDKAAHGADLGRRQEFHQQATDAIFERFYPAEAPSPGNLIHVSCTGYSSPSSAQKLVSSRGWGDSTLVTHAYHMGCYASIPAIRMGTAFVHQQGGTADVVHTELCTLHFDAGNHEIDQIVLQSLFADGYIKYTICEEDKNDAIGLRILCVHEQLIPDSAEAMTWILKGWGFQGSLSKKIPFLIAKHIFGFIETLASKAGVPAEHLLKHALFAIHPGGPKILDYIQETLSLSPEQLRFSRQVLKSYGNISSATLPHIWEAALADDSVEGGTLIVGLAFGPGLNIAGALLMKR